MTNLELRATTSPVQQDSLAGVEADAAPQAEDHKQNTSKEGHLRLEALGLRAQAIAHIGSWLIDIPGEQAIWSPATYRLLGIPEDTPVSAADFYAFMHPDDRGDAQAAWAAALGGAAYDIVHRIIVAGQVKWVRTQVEIDFDEQGGPLTAIGVVQDITAQRAAEEARRSSEQRLRAIFEGATEGIVAVNLSAGPDNVAFAFFNPAMCTLFGYTPEEFKTLHVPDLHPTEALPSVMEDFRALTSGERTVSADIPCQRKDGSIFYANIRVTMAEIDGATHAAAFFSDVTERHRNEALLRAQLRLRTMPPDTSIAELMRTTLDEARAITGSQSAHLQIFDENKVAFQQWSTSTTGEQGELDGAGHIGALADTGMWAESVRERQGKIYNDRAHLPQCAQLPVRHVDLDRLISAPVIRAGELVALILVANKPTDYDQQDLDMVSLLAVETWDIVQRKRTEAALRAGEERYRTLVESQEAVISTIDADGRHHFINGVGAAILGCTPEDIVGKALHDLFPPDHADRLLENVRAVIASGQGFVEESATPWQGKIRWNRTNLLPLRNAEGEVTLALINSVDITEHKEAELVLEERVRQRTLEIESIRQRLELATRAANIGIWDWNCVTGEMIWDDQMLQLYGITRAEFDGTVKSWERGVHPADLPLQSELVGFALRGERDFDTEFRVVWPDRSEHFLRARAITLFDEQGRPLRMIGVNYDVSVIRRAEQMERLGADTLRRANRELERAVRMKDDFLASMSHELRTPLTGILGLAELLQYATYGDLNEKQRRAVVNIETSGRHLLDLINDILDISKIEADKLELQMEPCSLDELCQASLQMVKGMAQHKLQHVSLAMNPSNTTILCDSRRLKQVLVNLLSNAVKFTPEGGSLGLEVAGDEQAQIMHLTVWDEGIGIAEHDLSKLFQPFVQVDSSLSREHTGTGLGLALVSRLASLHGGSVTVESTPGQGSRFTVSLPWAQDAGHDVEIVEDELHVARLLTVEDNELDAARLSRMLAALGIEYFVCSEGKRVLDYAHEVQPEVILLDINLPDRSGWDILADLKGDVATQNIPVIVVSVLDDQETAARLGAATSLVKPVLPSALRAALVRAQTHATAPAAPVATARVAASPVVMIVDDNQINIDTMRAFLETNGCRVVSASSGYEFLEKAPKILPDIVLMDIQMPGMDGLEATRRIRAYGQPEVASVPIIAVTALAMKGDRERCLAAGANEYVSKPMRMSDLLDLIRRLLPQ